MRNRGQRLLRNGATGERIARRGPAPRHERGVLGVFGPWNPCAMPAARAASSLARSPETRCWKAAQAANVAVVALAVAIAIEAHTGAAIEVAVADDVAAH